MSNNSELARLAARVALLERQVNRNSRAATLAYSSVEGGAIQVHDDDGRLTGIVGVQADGTTGVVVVNGAPPPSPSTPAVTSVLGGISVRWEGTFVDAVAAPLDFARVEVHTATVDGFVPGPETLRTTMESPRGGEAEIVTGEPVYVRLVARNTSGTAGAPSEQSGPVGPATVVAEAVLNGIVDELALAANAVSAANLQLGAVGSAALASGAVLEDKLAKAAVTLDKFGGAVVDAVTQRWSDAMADPAAWNVLAKAPAATWEHLSGITHAPTGQSLARATGYTVVRGRVQVPYDPDVLYRISARVRTAAPSAAGADTLYVGALGVAADGVTLVNRTGANTHNSAHYVAASNAAQPVASGWVTYTGYLRGRAPAGAPGTGGQALDPRTPGVMHGDTRFIAPIMFLNFAGGAFGASGVMEVDAFTIEVLKTGVVDSTNLMFGSVTTPHMIAGSINGDRITVNSLAGDRIVVRSITGEQIRALSITAAELAANSVTALQLAAGIVDATHIKAGSITARELSVDALNGKVVTGALIQTAESGRRIVLNPSAGSPALQIYSGSPAETAPGGISSDVIDLGTWRQPEVSVFSPSVSGPGAGLRLRSPESGGQGRVVLEPSSQSDGYAHLTVRNGGARADSEVTIYGARASALGGGYHSQVVTGAGITWTSASRQMTLADGVLTAPNIATGAVKIAPTPGVPTSVTVTGLNVAGKSHRAFVTANTTVPGTSVQGVGATGVSAGGLTVWLTRTGNTETTVWWMVVGS